MGAEVNEKGEVIIAVAIILIIIAMAISGSLYEGSTEPSPGYYEEETR